MPSIKFKQDFIVIPKQLVQDVFPSTNAVFIKVYIHILMLSANGENIVFSEVANSLQLLESDVMQAVKYWENLGALEISDSPEQTAGAEAPTEYEISEINRRLESNSKLSEMLQIAQEVLVRTLSSADIKSLYWLYDELGFSPEAILMLLEYCVSIGKKSMSYVERVATEWHKKGIITIEAITEFIENDEKKKNYMNNLKSIFGIHDRKLTGIEEDFIVKWHDDFGMSEEMIALAYEYCILRINKISFPYMDKIIEKWHKNNIFTISEAERENEEFKKNHTNNTFSFDILKDDSGADELERFTWDKKD